MVIVRKRLLSGTCEISVFFRHLNLDLLTSGYFQYFPYLDSQAFQTVMFHFRIFVCLFSFPFVEISAIFVLLLEHKVPSKTTLIK